MSALTATKDIHVNPPGRGTALAIVIASARIIHSDKAPGAPFDLYLAPAAHEAFAETKTSWGRVIYNLRWHTQGSPAGQWEMMLYVHTRPYGLIGQDYVTALKNHLASYGAKPNLASLLAGGGVYSFVVPTLRQIKQVQEGEKMQAEQAIEEAEEQII